MWRVVGASVQGTSHLDKNTPCQDAHACRFSAGGELLLAIADGAGSAERSQEGAQYAVQQVTAALDAALCNGVPVDEAGWRALIMQAFAVARQAVVQMAADQNASLRSFATTLACAVVCDDWLAVGQIGDGAAVAEDEHGALFVTARPQRGEYANEAYFLTMPDALNYVTIYVAGRPVRSLVLTTDGLLRLAFKLPEYEPSERFFQPLLAFMAVGVDPDQAQMDLAAFLNSPRVCARSDDDKTLVLATRAAQLEPLTNAGEPNQ
jgi:hypothetical protein